MTKANDPHGSAKPRGEVAMGAVALAYVRGEIGAFRAGSNSYAARIDLEAILARAERLEADNARLREALGDCEYALRCIEDAAGPDTEHPLMVSASVTPGLWSRIEVASHYARVALVATGKDGDK